MPRSSIIACWDTLSAQLDDKRSRLVTLAAEYRVSWSAVISHALTLELITRREFDQLASQRPTAADRHELGVRLDEELRPVALAPAFAQAAVRAYRRGVIRADRAVELLRGTISAEDLRLPQELPMEAPAPEFGRLG